MIVNHRTIVRPPMSDIDKLHDQYNELANRIGDRLREMQDRPFADAAELLVLAELLDRFGDVSVRYGMAVAQQPTRSIIAQLTEATRRAVAINPAPYKGFQPPPPPHTPAPAAGERANELARAYADGGMLVDELALGTWAFTDDPVPTLAAEVPVEPRSLPGGIEGHHVGGRPGREPEAGWTTRKAE